jgi:hypothetical protein
MLRRDPAGSLPRPTPDFRRRSWLAFQTALEVHLLRRGRGETGERLLSP